MLTFVCHTLIVSEWKIMLVIIKKKIKYQNIDSMSKCSY
jgi:hypothetical protein